MLSSTPHTHTHTLTTSFWTHFAVAWRANNCQKGKESRFSSNFTFESKRKRNQVRSRLILWHSASGKPTNIVHMEQPSNTAQISALQIKWLMKSFCFILFPSAVFHWTEWKVFFLQFFLILFRISLTFCVTVSAPLPLSFTCVSLSLCFSIFHVS